MAMIDSSNSSPTVIIKKLEYQPEIIEELKRLIHSNISEVVKKQAMRRRIRSFKYCCVCQGLPEYEVIYPLGNATKLEKYCHECFNKREESDSIDPNDYFVMVPKHGSDIGYRKVLNINQRLNLSGYYLYCQHSINPVNEGARSLLSRDKLCGEQ